MTSSDSFVAYGEELKCQKCKNVEVVVLFLSKAPNMYTDLYIIKSMSNKYIVSSST